MGSPTRRLRTASGGIADVDGALAILDWDTAVMMPRRRRGDARRPVRDPQAARARAADPRRDRRPAGRGRAGGATSIPGRRPTCARCAAAIATRHALEPALVEALARATTSCEMALARGARQGRFRHAGAELEEVVRLTREEAAATGAALGLAPYDALLDGYQPDLREPRSCGCSRALAAELPPLLDAVLARQTAGPCAPAGPFPAAEAEGAGPRA